MITKIFMTCLFIFILSLGTFKFFSDDVFTEEEQNHGIINNIENISGGLMILSLIGIIICIFMYIWK